MDYFQSKKPIQLFSGKVHKAMNKLTHKKLQLKYSVFFVAFADGFQYL